MLKRQKWMLSKTTRRPTWKILVKNKRFGEREHRVEITVKEYQGG